MATLDDLLGHTTEELAAMTDEELLAKYKDVFDLEPKPEGMALILEKPKVKKEKIPKADKPASRLDKLKAKLAKLNELTGDDENEDDE